MKSAERVLPFEDSAIFFVFDLLLSTVISCFLLCDLLVSAVITVQRKEAY